MRTSIFAALAFASAVGIAPVAQAQQPGDAAAGAEVFKKCRACHEVGPDAANKVGPILNGLFGRKSGTIAGFAYSEANKEAGAKGLIWDDAEFLKYIENPRAFMPGNKMAFAGLKDAQDRADLVAYLKTFK